MTHFDICVIGAGSGGLSVAAAAAQFGQKVVLFEKAAMGGDCLNTGCVPSKALLAASKAAHVFRTSQKFGIARAEPAIDFKQVHDHVHGVIAAIAPLDSVERFEGLGVRVIKAHAKFTGANTVEGGGQTVTARRFVIATGSTAATPPIPGIDTVPYLTNETIFENQTLPGHLVIIGGGPIGMEMAQAHRRLGAMVTVLEAFDPLAKDDPELTAVVLESLKADGIDIRARVKITGMRRTAEGIAIDIDGQGTIEGTHLLVAAGRKPTVDGLGLEAAGIDFTKRGVTVDDGLKTTNKKVYAIGDVAGGLQFTHVANYHAGLVIRNALFRLPVKNQTDNVPWVTYTDPELAHVGLTEAGAKERHGDQVKVLRWHFHENDRAQAERKTRGLVKAIVGKGGKILGCGIVGTGAGDLIQPWVLAMTAGLKVKALTDMIVPYPTRNDASKRAAIGYFSGLATKPLVRSVVGLLAKLG